MTVTKHTVVDRIAAYLRHDISLTDLVRLGRRGDDEGEFAEQDAGAIADAVARLGVPMSALSV